VYFVHGCLWVRAYRDKVVGVFVDFRAPLPQTFGPNGRYSKRGPRNRHRSTATVTTISVSKNQSFEIPLILPLPLRGVVNDIEQELMFVVRGR
jgi:hypothetical protein